MTEKEPSKEEKLSFIEEVIPALAQCKALGIKVTDIDIGSITLELPYSKDIIGNAQTGIIHGGSLTTLMDTACGFAAISAAIGPAVAPTLDLRIDYMRAAQPEKSVYGRAEVYRTTRNVLFARGIAFQESEDKPVAHCTATFMTLTEDALSAGREEKERSHV